MKLKIIKIIDETHDVNTFRLEKPTDFKFIPGQYARVAFPEKPADTRPFTFSSSPTSDHLDLTIKKMGQFTGRLFELKVGEELIVEGPLGETLNFNEDIKGYVTFIAGGSGITPFMSAIRYAIAKNLPNNITLLFANKTPTDIIYKDELESIKDKIQIVNVISDDEYYEGEKGRITKELIKKYTGPEDNIYYICGPVGFTKAMETALKELKAKEIKNELWQIPGKSDKEVK